MTTTTTTTPRGGSEPREGNACAEDHLTAATGFFITSFSLQLPHLCRDCLVQSYHHHSALCWNKPQVLSLPLTPHGFFRLPPPVPVWPGMASPFAPASLPAASPFAAKSPAVSPPGGNARGSQSSGSGPTGERCILTSQSVPLLPAAFLKLAIDDIVAKQSCRVLPAAAPDVPKPRSDAAPGEKEAYVLTKYVRRRYAPLPAALPGGTVQAAMWEAAKMGDVRCGRLLLSFGVRVIQV